MSSLPAIPVVDVRDGGAVRLASQDLPRARALRDACIAFFPRIARPLLPLVDGLARRWLMRSQSPYVDEIGSIAAALGFSGIWLLNGSYQWSCTALARDDDGAPWLARTLDWPFSGLGRYVEIARMRGPAGDYLNVTWPGYVGVLTAVAPARFGAAINQAPMLRRTHHRLLRVYDFAANAVDTMRHARAIPPDQLLRRAFETCRDYAEAKRLLEITPIARPVIYTLAGCRPGERCVIERTVDGARTREGDTCAANDWLDSQPQWEGRIGADKVLTSTYEEAAAYSRARRETFAQWQGSLARETFGWVVPPVLNSFTRLAVEMCPARGILRAVGYERAADGEPAQPATLAREVRADELAA